MSEKRVLQFFRGYDPESFHSTYEEAETRDGFVRSSACSRPTDRYLKWWTSLGCFEQYDGSLRVRGYQERAV